MRSVLLVLSAAFAAAQYQSRQMQYGKYWTYYMGVQSYESNTYYLYSPQNITAGKKLPILIQFHGGGFTGGSADKRITAEHKAFIDQGMHYASVDYRLVGDKHYYGPSSAPKEHEFIHAYSNGTLAPDTTGMVMSDYKVKVGRQEFNTMCSYDAAAALEHIIAHADEYGIDVHRIGFTGGSAGGGEINYLTWVYHAMHTDKYTPVSMHYTMAQLDYPVQNMVNAADGSDGGPWNLWANDVGSDVKLSTILSKTDCGMIVGNPFCDTEQSEMNLCNKTWHTDAMDRYCGDAFDSLTLGQMAKERTWPMDTEHDRGLWKLWSTSQNMLHHQPKGSSSGGKFYLYVANRLNSTAGMNVVHNALYSRNYGKYADKAGGINYAVYYTDYEAMGKDDIGAKRFQVDDAVYNYRSNFDWVNLPGVSSVGRTSMDEYVLFHCHAMGLTCKAAPPTPPSPPGPPAPLEPVSSMCGAAINKTCPSQRSEQDCDTCIRSNAKTLIPAGCPPANEDGFKRCVNFCEHRSS